MSGFEASWLELREPVDHAARNAPIARRAQEHFADRAALTVVDLGCGTGSNLRAFAPSLPRLQHWQLIDGDNALLHEARRSLARWADNARDTDDELHLIKGEHQIRVSFEAVDLTACDLHFSDTSPDLVTAAALFDLVSAAWLERLVSASAQRRTALYAVLNYDGVARWRPDAALDERVVAAFNRHQNGDKGFGPALGPATSDAFAGLLSKYGYRSWQGESPWTLGANDRPLIAALTTGFAQAAAEIEPDMADEFAAWARERADAANVVIGHQDIFAVI